jgi:hypothetical protein
MKALPTYPRLQILLFEFNNGNISHLSRIESSQSIHSSTMTTTTTTTTCCSSIGITDRQETKIKKKK